MVRRFLFDLNKTFNNWFANNIVKMENLCRYHSMYSERCSIDNVNGKGSIFDLFIMIGMNVPMKHDGAGLTYFSFHVEDGDLSSIPYLEGGTSKVWYVCPLWAMCTFQDYYSTFVFRTDYMIDYNNCGRPMFHDKTLLFNPCLSCTHGVFLQTYRDIQTRGIFVILARRA